MLITAVCVLANVVHSTQNNYWTLRLMTSFRQLCSRCKKMSQLFTTTCRRTGCQSQLKDGNTWGTSVRGQTTELKGSWT